MKKTHFLILISSIIFLSFTEKYKSPEISKKETTVYVCGKSKIYHKKKTHAALKRCTSGISTTTESKAKKLGKRDCKCRDK